MPEYGECGIYDPDCRRGTCAHKGAKRCGLCRKVECVCPRYLKPEPAPKPEFTRSDLNLIRAMCMSANPQFPERAMYPAWVPVYETATALLAAVPAEPRHRSRSGRVPTWRWQRRLVWHGWGMEDVIKEQ